MAMKWKVIRLAVCAGTAPAYSQSIATVAGGGPNNLAPLVSSIGVAIRTTASLPPGERRRGRMRIDSC
jgi:hypothetical protein